MPTLKERLAEAHAQQKCWASRIRDLYAESLKAPEAEKACPDTLAEMLAEPDLIPSLTYPVEVHGISVDDGPGPINPHRHAGRYVSIRPCTDPGKDKTYLGIYLGDLATYASVRLSKDGVLAATLGGHNPAIWVPALNRIVFGRESWWGVLEKPEDLREITDADIQDVWYVKALASLKSTTASE